MWSTDVDKMLPNMIEMLLQLSKTKQMTFGRSKTVSNILVRLVGCLIASDEINKLNDLVDFVEKLWIHPQTQKMLLLSEAMMHHMRMFDTVLERPKVIFLAFESPRNITVILGNTLSTSVDLIVAQNK